MKRTVSFLVILLALIFSALGVTPAQALPAPDCNLPGNLIVNCGFEAGFAGWVTQDLLNPLFPLGVYPAGTPGGFFISTPTELNLAVLTGFDGTGPGTIRVAQDVAIPPSVSALLTFDYRAAWDMFNFLGSTQNRVFFVTIEPFGGGPMLFQQVILTAPWGTNVNDTGPLGGTVDLSAFAGQAIRISFDWWVPEINTGPAFAQLDNVSLQTIPLDTTPPVVTVPANMTVEATSPAGAVVTFSATATDETDPANPAVTCIPPSGSTFPLGTTTVNCSATDTAGNTGTNSFTITVQDTTPPTVTVPANMTVEATGPSGAVVNYIASASDPVGLVPPLVCTPPSGSTFPIGTTTVNCSIADTAGNTGTNSFTITVQDTTAPIVTVPASMTVEATGPGGRVVSFSTSATDIVAPLNPAVTCIPPSGSTFPLGTTTVNCSATDTAGNTGTNSFTITVQDTTAPIVTVPANMTIEATGPGGRVVSFSTSATDIVAPLNPAVICIPPSGSTFPLGTTTVNCSATDTAGNTGTNSFTITVRDTTAPIVTVPANMTVEATGPAGAVVTYSGASATDIVAPLNPAVTCALPSGSTFPLGVNTVNCSATDTAGNTGSNSFTINVRDTTAPILNLPADMNVSAFSPAGTVVNFTATATDVVDTTPTVLCTPSSGSNFPLGITRVNCSATDDAGNSTPGFFTIRVIPSHNVPQLLKMPTFDNLTSPIPWKIKILPVPFVTVRDCTVSLSPNCSVKFVGKSTNPLRYAEQTFIRRGNAGDKFYFGLSSRAENVPTAGLYKVDVFFYDLRNRVVGTQALNFSIGTHDWETVGTTYTVPAAYYRVAFRFTYQKTAGMAWFDNAFLMVVP